MLCHLASTVLEISPNDEEQGEITVRVGDKYREMLTERCFVPNRIAKYRLISVCECVSY
jgi:hypothetical protein